MKLDTVLAGLAIISVLFLAQKTDAQSCCAGGSGSPIAGGISQGVLADKQFEVASSFQYINSNKFMTGDKPVDNFLDNFNSKYLYTRFAYGVTKALTMSVETGYYFNKTQVGLDKRDTVGSKGFGDLILFPRYCIYTHNTEKTRNEITVGMGFKIPVGKYLDSSVVYIDASGKKYYTPKPPAVMPTTGSNDFIFYGFLYRGYPQKNFRVFSSLLYVRKGWNPLGQKFGDYASVSLFAAKTYFNKLILTLQLKGEWVAKMDYDKSIDMLAKYNLDVNSTGGKRVLLGPQVGYCHNSYSVFLLSEIPLYQYVNGTAIASQYLFTVGFSYRFFAVKQNG